MGQPEYDAWEYASMSNTPIRASTKGQTSRIIFSSGVPVRDEITNRIRP